MMKYLPKLFIFDMSTEWRAPLPNYNLPGFSIKLDDLDPLLLTDPLLVELPPIIGSNKKAFYFFCRLYDLAIYLCS